MKIYSSSGFELYDKLPDGYRLAKLDDFLEKGRRRIGMQFLIQWVSNPDLYQICHVSINLTSTFLNQFIADDRVYIQTEQ